MCVNETTPCYSHNSGTPRKCIEDRSRRGITPEQKRKAASPESPSEEGKP